MNKNRKIKISFVLLFAIIMFLGCTEDFEKLNTRKDLVTDDVVDVDLIFTRVQAYAFVRDPYGESTNNRRSGIYSGILMSSSGGLFDIDEYPGVWNATYRNYARNLSRIIQLTEDDPDLVNKTAIARIMKVWAFSQCTDLYGDIPYSQTALPLDQIDYTPKYDTQKSIYEDFFKELKEAASQLDASKDSYGSADLLYAGDVTKWKKFANSLRLRLALRVRYVDNNMANAQMSDLSDAELITNSDDDAFTTTSTDYNANLNSLYQGLGVSGSETYKTVLSKTMIDLWQDHGDPRLAFYADTAMAAFKSFGYRGRPVLGDAPQEQKNPYSFESVSRYSWFMYAPVIPLPVLTAAEVNFALSEAALFGLKGSEQNAQDYYKKGIEAALNWSLMYYEMTTTQLGDVFSLYDSNLDADYITAYDAFHALTQSEIGAFLDTAAVVTLTGSQEEKLEMILNQKMLSYFPDMPYEGYAEWRRTGYPRVLVGDDTGDLQGVAPRRYNYPRTEQTLNADNYSEVKDKDKMTIKVWWDANPNSPHQHSGMVESMDSTWIEIYQ